MSRAFVRLEFLRSGSGPANGEELYLAGDTSPWQWVEYHTQDVRIDVTRQTRINKCGAIVVRVTSCTLPMGPFQPTAAPSPGSSLERTTGLEPATLTLAR